MRLSRIRAFMDAHRWPYRYSEEDDAGSIDFQRKGLSYHIWEYPAPERGAESNVRSAGRAEDFEGDYEGAILEILASWESL